ncbi:hypothetical protein MMC22_011257 [Lobaria immixta]|nr:hypothetical protein [Lobaria immixta]
MSLLIPLHRTFISSISRSTHSHFHQTQTRCASLLKRPKRPYTFTQLVTLSDGSSYTHRTTSPASVYKSNRDTRNTALWNPSSQHLLNIEEDEAGKLRSFRNKFGRGWDAERKDDIAAAQDEDEQDQDENLMDLITGFGQGVGAETKDGLEEKRSGKGKEKLKGEKRV